MRQQLLLGTAQWGLDYGITNSRGRIPDPELDRLVEKAQRLGIGALDTAPGYGDAEVRIAQFAPNFRVQTKVSAAGRCEADIRKEIADSQRHLQVDQIWRVLVHDWTELQDHERSLVIKVLTDLRQSRVLDHFGISVYTEFDLLPIRSNLRGVSVIQVPVSVLDQRLRESESLEALREMGVTIQARSIFLQGLLLDALSGKSNRPELMKFAQEVQSRSLNAVDVCVSFIRAQAWIDEMVIGATSSNEVEQICKSFSEDSLQLDWDDWAATDESLLDPRTWSNS